MVAKPVSERNLKTAEEQLADMTRWVEQAALNGTAAHEVERHILHQVLGLGLGMVNRFVEAVGPGDLGPTVTLEGGRIVKRLPELQSRRMVTVFGEITVPRYVYGTRPGQKIELVPTDQRLKLPQSEVSYLLQEWDQMLGVESAFGKVAQTLASIAGVEQPVDTLERGNRQMAEAAPAFRAQQPAPDPDAEGSILVASEDNKGVPMVRPVQAVAPGSHRKKGEKANKKQMACIGCVYSVNPHIRTPDDVIAALFREAPAKGPKGPKAVQKRYWAELSREEKGQAVRAQKEVFLHMAADIALRRKPDQILLHLCDGQRSLETDRGKYLPTDQRTIDILDLMHVLPRMWEAAHLFHTEGSNAAKQFVRDRLPQVLGGRTADVIAQLRKTGSEQHLSAAKSTRLKKLCAFLETNLHRMKYDEYLRAGYPIATGVIEGACRHVIKDRMERTGMRWKVPGANAMLQLRTIFANGDWKPFVAFRIQRETMRLYPHQEAVEAIPWPIAA
jgi:hypothetical protein